MHRFRNKLLPMCLLLVAAVAGFAQSAEQLESPEVNRVADKLLCSCGCKMNMACRMEPYPCRVCWENKKKILQMQNAGFSDKQILDKFARDEGKDVVAVTPGVLGSLTFYAAAFLGLILVAWAIRKYSRKPVALAGAPPENQLLDRYHEQIEKEVEKLD